MTFPCGPDIGLAQDPVTEWLIDGPRRALTAQDPIDEVVAANDSLAWAEVDTAQGSGTRRARWNMGPPR